MQSGFAPLSQTVDGYDNHLTGSIDETEVCDNKNEIRFWNGIIFCLNDLILLYRTKLQTKFTKTWSIQKLILIPKNSKSKSKFK